MEYVFQMFKGLGVVIILGVASLYFYYQAKKEADKEE